MERDSPAAGAAEKTEPASSSRKNATEEAGEINSHMSRDATCATAEVAKARDNLGPLRVNEVLNSFDNTGNVCVWPSEEVMAHYCLQNRHIFNLQSYMKGIRQARRAECRVTAANGVMAQPDKHPASNEKALRLPSSPVTMQLLNRVAVCADANEVLLSDGNEKSIHNVRELVERNEQAGKFGSTRVSARVVRWDCESDVSALEGHFNTILCADWEPCGGSLYLRVFCIPLSSPFDHRPRRKPTL
ncbi:hypothetical protein fugu_012556 [Takifugu bimaculatus]|uniref:Uncharacterized protein n=1 Tax=Takifugu bimaculatus TaxID=433685 RepID=A0A4Z2C5S0_9TELE|nr:hypothetical protein fugu_012556 [Takifugu bimaculatus]